MQIRFLDKINFNIFVFNRKKDRTSTIFLIQQLQLSKENDRLYVFSRRNWFENLKAETVIPNDIDQN
ncbi:hypothetical protein LEP1GSC191_3434 [Leptospira borgpetersenii serovar Mini str. 201000851]|uniref:Uncharacterized protein n=2 Tax=Leptospira borgpetersenii TaxID=174 RepID=M3GUY1_LEPBO|nr:hypothetical protein LEP1GSC128_1730 [Leptospira borgpetersenii str. 200801926]EMF98638.1 hypothetical protein LEP1GSC123_2454 [Leptospira borgpetersenii str. 200701203]ENO63358.1 hypothetical protein LEP1GSC191_3434 [Leptospira borgpetersenii serovar Mini str. 201000851]